MLDLCHDRVPFYLVHLGDSHEIFSGLLTSDVPLFLSDFIVEVHLFTMARHNLVLSVQGGQQRVTFFFEKQRLMPSVLDSAVDSVLHFIVLLAKIPLSLLLLLAESHLGLLPLGFHLGVAFLLELLLMFLGSLEGTLLLFIFAFVLGALALQGIFLLLADALGICLFALKVLAL